MLHTYIEYRSVMYLYWNTVELHAYIVIDALRLIRNKTPMRTVVLPVCNGTAFWRETPVWAGTDCWLVTKPAVSQ